MLRRDSSFQRADSLVTVGADRRLHTSGRAVVAPAAPLSARPAGFPRESAVRSSVLAPVFAADHGAVLRLSLPGDGGADPAVADAGQGSGEGGDAAAADAEDVYLARRGAVPRQGAARDPAEDVRVREREVHGDRVALQRILHAVALHGRVFSLFLTKCFDKTNVNQFKRESMFFFIDLLKELAKNDKYVESVASIMVTIPCLVFDVTKPGEFDVGKYLSRARQAEDTRHRF